MPALQAKTDSPIAHRVSVNTALLLAGLLFVPLVHADADDWNVDGEHGVIVVKGTMTESTCNLDMASSWQEVMMTNIATGALQHIGDRGTPVTFSINLLDCLPVASRTIDERTGLTLWAPHQPSVALTFTSPADADNPALVKLPGVSGIGLRLLDVAGRDIRLGSRGAPLFLEAGNNQLHYTLVPERTRAPLHAGAYRAQINFQLNYD